MNASGINVDFDTQRFNRVLNAYLKYSGRSFTNEVNKRSFNIALKAVGKTPKVTAQKIKRDMMRAAKIQPSSSKRGKRAPVAAILTNYHRGKKGKKGMWGEPMKNAVATAIAHRQKGRGFMAAAWLGTASDIGPYIKPPRSVRGSRTKFQIGKPKGEGKPERRIGALKPFARGVHGSKESGNIPGARQGLRLAFNMETRDMLTYLRRKIPKDWHTTKKTNAVQSLAIRKL